MKASAPSSSPAIAVRNATLAFGPRQALAGVDLHVSRGELLGLIGPNGAGKSTLLRALIGLVTLDGGEAGVLGLDPARDPLAVRRRVSYLPGETSVYQQMTGQQFLDFALGFYPGRQSDLLDRLQQGFALPLERRVRTFSAGMKQKLAILATLGPDVDVYLLDEPDRALDATVRFFLREVLRDLKHAGKTIVLSSHHLSEVESLADRTEFLVAGRVVAPAALTAAREQLARRMRLRLAPGQELPPGVRLLHHETDGMLLVHCDIDPLDALRQLPEGALLGAEIGIVRLEELYQQLLQATPQPAGGRA
ncbi:MAG: ABC transporter ATP-binding protein [Planctomycetes bacterium]|nr:ABC transporter ATP-binding protein [Planctomycetota bacterium]